MVCRFSGCEERRLHFLSSVMDWRRTVPVMILVMDIGNSNIVVGSATGEQIHFSARLATDLRKTQDQWAAELMGVLTLFRCQPQRLEGAILSSVVPQLSSVLQGAVRRLVEGRTLLLGPGLRTGLNIRTDNPAQLGSDLAAGAVAAIQSYPLPLVVADLGTATTLSVINGQGEYVGGAILPGVQLGLETLCARAAQLPHIDLSAPRRVIGKSTVERMNSGVIFGNAAMLDGMLELIRQELGCVPTVVATGGLAPLIVPHCRWEMTLDQQLILRGLSLIYDKNRKG